jgi:predicted phosphodiesterase
LANSFFLKDIAMKRFRLLLLPLLLLMLVTACTTAGSFESNSAKVGPHPWTALPAAPPAGQPLRFVIIPDRNGGERPGVYPKAVALAAKQDPQFVISVGDQISGYTSNTQTIQHQWANFEEVIKPLPVPYFYVAGNHDITSIFQREAWAKRFGPLYYSFKYDGALFICLNTFDVEDRTYLKSVDPVISPRQVEFVRQTLAENPGPRWVFVFMHVPLWQQKKPVSGFQAIETMLQPYGYTMFAGHTHRYQYTKRLGRDYITLATAGGSIPRKARSAGQFDHCMLVTLEGDKPTCRNLLLDGRELPVDFSERKADRKD